MEQIFSMFPRLTSFKLKVAKTEGLEIRFKRIGPKNVTLIVKTNNSSRKIS